MKICSLYFTLHWFWKASVGGNTKKKEEEEEMHQQKKQTNKKTTHLNASPGQNHICGYFDFHQKGEIAPVCGK